MVKPWMMLVAAFIILAILAGYDVKEQFEQEDFEEVVDYFEGMDDWEMFKETDFTLHHRLDLNGKLTYTVSYQGNNLAEDLDTLGSTLISLHEGEIVILVQSSYNKELITFMYENGEVVKIK